MIRKISDSFFQNFGFVDTSDLMNSMVHSKLLLFTFSISAVGTIIERTFGLMPLTLVAFCVLLFLELITGLWASKVKGNKIESRKFSRFGIKFLVWTLLFFVLNTLKIQYEGNNKIAFYFWEWLHTFIVGYVNLEYLISVLENIGVISGKDNTKLIKAITGKFDSIFGSDKKQK